MLPSVFPCFHFFPLLFCLIWQYQAYNMFAGCGWGRRLAWTLCCASTGFMGRHMRMFGSVTTQDFYPIITMYTHPYLSFTFHLLLIHFSFTYLYLYVYIYIISIYFSTFLFCRFFEANCFQVARRSPL